jgi:uncharacterized delta-60 repeat protein
MAGGTGTGGSVASGSGGAASGTGGASSAGTGGAAAGGGGGGAASITDTDIVLARFNADGTPDASFGMNGIFRKDLAPNSGNTREVVWGVDRDAQDRLLIFGFAKGEGARTDSDRFVMRLTANGQLDTSFGMDAPGAGGASGSGGAGGAPGKTGMFVINIGNVSDTARNGRVLPDGKILTAGYYPQPTGVGTQTANRVLLARFTADGILDTSFGAGGLSSANPFTSPSPTTQWGMAEAYGAVQQPMSGKYVTTGYGRLAPSGQVNVVSFRFDAAGAFDTSWGTNGVFEKDIAGANDRGRNLAALSDDRIVIAGSAEPAAGNVDAMVMLLSPAGALDTTFNTTGYVIKDFGRIDEAFYGVAVGANNLIAAGGYRAGAMGTNDDALLFLSPAPAGMEGGKELPLSATGHDRLWAVAFDAAGQQLYGAGFVTAGGDNSMALVKINPTTGAIDTAFGPPGGGGVVTANASVGAALEEARGVTVQSTGKIVIAGVAESRD